MNMKLWAYIPGKLPAARSNDCPRSFISDHKSPTFAMRAAIVRKVNLCGVISPWSSSSHVHGADTGAPGLARTA